MLLGVAELTAGGSEISASCSQLRVEQELVNLSGDVELEFLGSSHVAFRVSPAWRAGL